MKQSNMLRIFMLGTFLFSFTLVGCGDDAGDDATEVDVDIEEGTAEAGQADTEDLKEAMMDMTKEMHGIVSEIETVEDVRGVDEEIGEIFDNLVEKMRGAMKNPAAMQAMEQEVENDPEMKEWSDKMDAAMAQLQTDHPEAAAELETVMQKHSMKLMTLIGEAMQNMNPEDMQGMMDGAEGDSLDVPADESGGE
jgi:hypothetical protein